MHDLCAKVDQIAANQEAVANSAYKVFDTEHPDLTGSSSPSTAIKPYGAHSRPSGHDDDHDHRGLGNGVVTTLIPTPVTGAKHSQILTPPIFAAYSPDMNQFYLNHAIPLMEFPEFDGSCPKLWIKKSNNYFDNYGVPEFRKYKTAYMHFTGNAEFWAQSLDFAIQELAWSELCKLVCDRFEMDQHNLQLRQFFRIKQNDSIADYIEKFDSIVHQILAHDPKFSTATITNRFIDGLKDDIRSVVLVHRRQNLDAASSIALLQEEYTREIPKKDYKKSEFSSGFRHSGRSSGSSYGHNAASSSLTKGTELSSGIAKKGNDNAKGYQPEDKATTLMNYKKAKGALLQMWHEMEPRGTSVLHLCPYMWLRNSGRCCKEMNLRNSVSQKKTILVMISYLCQLMQSKVLTPLIQLE
jgi:hypothetical protein